ncbi:MAG: hypothetical protein WC856_15575 [Methylococcaceae bacterium]
MRGNLNKEESLFLSPHPGLLAGGEGESQTRWRCFSRDWIKTQKGDSLDIAWLKDQDSVDAASLPEPDVLAAEAMSELTEALRELNGLMQALGAGDQAQAQNDLLAEVLGLGESA